jgi:hypothetical protein
VTWELIGALGGTRTPNLLIRRQCRACHRPGHSTADLSGQFSSACVVFRCYSVLCGQNQATSGRLRLLLLRTWQVILGRPRVWLSTVRAQLPTVMACFVKWLRPQIAGSVSRLGVTWLAR